LPSFIMQSRIAEIVRHVSQEFSVNHQKKEKKMGNELPGGVKVTIRINYISMVLFTIGAIILTIGAVPQFRDTVQKTGGEEVSMIFVIMVGIAIFCFCLIPAIILFFLTKGISALNSKARIIQIIWSCLNLLLFPIGTVINGVILYFLIFDSKTKEAFKNIKIENA